MPVKRDARDRVRNLVRGGVAVLLVAVAAGTSVATTKNLPIAAAQPPTVTTDSRGYVNSPARCDPGQTAVVTGRTALSLVAICTDGRSSYQYRGMRLSDRAILTLPATPLFNGCFGARSDAINFTVSEHKLLLTAGLRVLRDEPMLEYRDDRIPTLAPTARQTVNQQFR